MAKNKTLSNYPTIVATSEAPSGWTFELRQGPEGYWFGKVNEEGDRSGFNVRESDMPAIKATLGQ